MEFTKKEVPACMSKKAAFAILMLFAASIVVISASICTPAYALTASDFKAPKITKIDMTQAYSVTKNNDCYYGSDGKKYAEGPRSYAYWGKNKVTIKFALRNKSYQSATVNIQRSTSPSKNFKNIGKDVYASRFIDETASRGQKYYYRVVVQYKYYDMRLKKDSTVKKVSNVVSIRTSPKTLKTWAKVKTAYGWSTKMHDRAKNKPLFKSNKSNTMRISWSKRSDVDGYFVYRINPRWISLKNARYWHYAATEYGFGSFFEFTSKKWCKKVATLKKTATSYSCKISNTKARSSRDSYRYVVVPYIKQNGKTYIGDCVKVHSLSLAGVNVNSGGSWSRPSPIIDRIEVLNKDFKAYVPFPLL